MYGHAFHDQGRVHYQSPNPNTLNSTATEVDSSSGNDDGSLEDFHLPPLIRDGGGRSYARDEKCGHATHGESVENSKYVGDDLVAAKTGRWPPQYRIRGECGRRVRGASIFDIDEIDSGPDNLKVTAANGTAMAENPFAGIDGRDQENVAPGRAHAPESHSRAMTDGPRTNFRRRDQDRAAGSPRLLEAESDYAGAPVPSLYIPKPQTHFIAEDDVSAPSQASTTSRDTDEDSLVDVIDTQTWGSESQSSTSTLRSSSPKDESGRAGPTAGPSDNHDGAAFRRLRRSYGAGTADRTNIATAPGGDVHRGILACERYAGTSRPDDGPVRDYVWSYSQTTSG